MTTEGKKQNTYGSICSWLPFKIFRWIIQKAHKNGPFSTTQIAAKLQKKTTTKNKTARVIPCVKTLICSPKPANCPFGYRSQ